MLKYKTIAEPISLRYFSVATGVAVVHLVTGIDLLIGGPSALSTTPLYFLSFLAGNRGDVVAMILLTASVLAIIPFLWPNPTRLLFMGMIAPQQVLLLFHFVSVMIAIISGRYPDGYLPAGGAYFIVADQSWLMMLVILHTYEYIETL